MWFVSSRAVHVASESGIPADRGNSFTPGRSSGRLFYASAREKKAMATFGVRAFRALFEAGSLETAESYEPARAAPVDVEVEDEMNEVMDSIWANSMSPKRAMPVDREVDNEMDEVLDTIEMEQHEPRRAIPVDREVDAEMDEVMDTIWADSLTPRRAMPTDAEVDGEMQEVLDSIEADKQWKAKASRRGAGAKRHYY